MKVFPKKNNEKEKNIICKKCGRSIKKEDEIDHILSHKILETDERERKAKQKKEEALQKILREEYNEPLFYTLMNKKDLKNNTQCMICLEDFKIGEHICVFPCIDHIFHEKCGITWIVNSSETCPICKIHVKFNPKSAQLNRDKIIEEEQSMKYILELLKAEKDLNEGNKENLNNNSENEYIPNNRRKSKRNKIKEQYNKSDIEDEILGEIENESNKKLSGQIEEYRRNLNKKPEQYEEDEDEKEEDEKEDDEKSDSDIKDDSDEDEYA